MIRVTTAVPPRSRAGLAVLATFLLLAISACKKEEAQYVAPPPPQVTVALPVVKDITQYMDFTGRTEAVESVEIRARVRGFLDKPRFTDGTDVKAGQELYRIDPREYEANLAGAEAALEAVEAARNLAEATWKRMDQAAQSGALSKLDAIEAKAKLEVSEAQINTVLALVADAKLQLEYTSIKSPIEGRIGRTLVTEGNLVGQGEPTLLTTVVRQHPLFAYFSVSERDLLMLIERRNPERKYENLADVPADERLRMVIQLADGATYVHPGSLDYSDNTIDPATGVLRMRVVIPNPEFKIFPGLFVRVRAPFETKGAILVPEVALQRDLAGYFLMIVDDEDTVVRTKVTPGGRMGDQRVIKEGLTADRRVIINGLQRARPGIKVEVTDPGKPAKDTPRKPADEGE